MKPSNPKDSVGIKKAPLSAVPGPVLFEVGLALLEGARKYGRHNWRSIGVSESVYFDAAMRHLWAYWEGEDVDCDSGLFHITKAIAGLMVLRDCQIQGLTVDDRPPKTKNNWLQLSECAKYIIEKYPNPPKAYCEKEQ